MMKSIGAVFAGFLVVAVLSIGTDTILEKSIFPNIPLLLALAYRTVYAVLGGYVTAYLAPGARMKHVVALTVIGTILGSLGAMANWGKSDNWYPISLVIISFFAVLGGGKLKKE